jgi:calcineurin-like phosphoesterase family protein
MPRTIISLAAFFVLVAPVRAATGIIAIGDFGVGGERQAQIGASVRAFEERNPAQLLLTLGDNDYTRARAFQGSWESSFGWLGNAGLGVAGTLGNHDVQVSGGRYEFRALAMPGAYYTRKVGDVQLFILNSNAITPRQTRWLRNALASSTARWKIAALHHPPYTCGGHEGSVDAQRAWGPLFERYRVRLVLSGHDHNYQRFAPRRGVTYVVDGGGGAGLYALRACPRGYPRRLAARAAHGFLYLEASAQALSVRAVALDGTSLDRFAIGP